VKTRTVVLYGGNLVMSSVGAGLQDKLQFQVRQIEASAPDTIHKLEAAPPDVILFDLAKPQPDFAMPLLRNHPKIMLIGIDLEGNKMLVLSGEQSRLLTTEDLVQVIEGSVLK
jgi:DNA-binding NarL/FixJ family response regulator